MSWIGRFSGGARATAATLGMIVLVLASLAIGVFNEQAYWRARTDSLAAQAGVLAGTIEPALVFQDPTAAQEAVLALAADRQVEAAGVYDPSGRLIARFVRAGDLPAGPPAPGRGWLPRKATVSAPVTHEGRRIGAVYLRTTAEPLAGQLGRHAGIALLLLTGVGVVTVLQRAQSALRRTVRVSEARAADLARANLDLETEIARRERAEEALRQSQKMETLGQLTGGIAHDFNNLLQSVQGSLDLINRRPDQAERVARLARAGLEAAERGARLTSQLLAFSRAQKLELHAVDVRAVATRLREILPSALGPNVKVAFDLGEAPLPVIADVTQLELAVLNLCINARDAMPSGGEITIAARPARLDDDPELAPGDYLLLSVTDTGAGMAPEVRERAFEPFFTTKKVGKGTGLGLAQVYGIAKQAGGVARIDSRPGEGTTVTIYLPRAEADARPSGDEDSPGPAPQVEGARILVIDDDATVRAYVVEALESFGYAPLSAADGAAGLEILGREPVDLLVVDYAMPGMTGAEVAHSALARRPGLPIVFISGYAESDALERAVGHPAHLLRKPFDTGALGHAVYEALSRAA
ncbi:MAG: ATP-binding protein [Pseudomonadota bacterium]